LPRQIAHNKFSGLPENLQAVRGLFPFPVPVALHGYRRLPEMRHCGVWGVKCEVAIAGCLN
jgi:hypothetical protein